MNRYSFIVSAIVTALCSIGGIANALQGHTATAGVWILASFVWLFNTTMCAYRDEK